MIPFYSLNMITYKSELLQSYSDQLVKWANYISSSHGKTVLYMTS